MSVYEDGSKITPVLGMAGYLDNSPVTITSLSWTATNTAVTITPKFVDSKVLILLAGHNPTLQRITLYRNATNLFSSDYGFSWSLSQNECIQYLDSPGTTSPVTYRVYGKRYFDFPAYTVYWGWSNSTPAYGVTCAIIAIEIGVG